MKWAGRWCRYRPDVHDGLGEMKEWQWERSDVVVGILTIVATTVATASTGDGGTRKGMAVRKV